MDVSNALILAIPTFLLFGDSFFHWFLMGAVAIALLSYLLHLMGRLLWVYLGHRNN